MARLSELARNAGFGSRIWSIFGSLAANHYRKINALLTALVFAVGTIPYLQPELTFPTIALYVIYSIVRQNHWVAKTWIIESQKGILIRIEFSYLFLAGVMYLLGPAERVSPIWILFVSLLLLVSWYLSTDYFWIFLLQTLMVLFGVRLLNIYKHEPFLFLSIPSILRANLDVFGRFLSLFLIAFIMHYLARNIMARDDTIRGLQLGFEPSNKRSSSPLNRIQRSLEPILNLAHGKGCALLYDFGNDQIFESSMTLGNFDEQQLDHLLIHVGQGKWRLACEVNQPKLSDDYKYLIIPLMNPAGKTFPPAALVIIALSDHAISQRDQLIQKTQIYVRKLFLHFFKNKKIPALLSDFTDPGIGVEYLQNIWHILNAMGEYIIFDIRSAETEARKTGLELATIGNSLRLVDVQQLIVEAIVNKLGYRLASLYWVDESEGVIKKMKVAGDSVDQLDGELVYPLNGNDVPGEMIRTGKTVIMQNCASLDHGKNGEDTSVSPKTLVVTPISIVEEGQTLNVGIIEAVYETDDTASFPLIQVALLNIFLNAAQTVVKNAIDYERASEHAELFQNLSRESQSELLFSKLFDATQSLAKPLDVLGILSQYANVVSGFPEKPLVLVYQYNTGSRTWSQPIVAGKLYGDREIRPPSTQVPILRKLLASKDPYYSSNAQTDPLLIEPAIIGNSNSDRSHLPKSFTCHQRIISFAGLPLQVGGEFVGALCINYRKRKRFDENDKTLTEFIAQLIANTIKTSRAIQQTRQTVMLEERNRIARELHSSFTTLVPTVKLHLQVLQRTLSPDDPLQETIKKAMYVSKVMQIDLDYNVYMLRNHDESIPWKAQLIETICFFEDHYQMEITKEYDLHLIKLSDHIGQDVVHILREGLMNIVRHAKINQACVKMYISGDNFVFSIKDNGCGFVQSKKKRVGTGMKSINEWVEKHQGSLTIQSRSEFGTYLEVIIPLP